MPKSHTHDVKTSPAPLSPFRAHLGGGNGASLDPDGDRLVRIEALIDRLQEALDIQFQRTAEMQAQLDRAIADRPIKPVR